MKMKEVSWIKCMEKFNDLSSSWDGLEETRM